MFQFFYLAMFNPENVIKFARFRSSSFHKIMQGIKKLLCSHHHLKLLQNKAYVVCRYKIPLIKIVLPSLFAINNLERFNNPNSIEQNLTKVK